MRTNQGLNEIVESVETGSEQRSTQSSCSVCDLSIRRAEEMIHCFPTTRYYGSKKRLLPWLFESLKDIPFQTVLDGFGGTSSVSLLFKAMGKEVTFNDALISNVISAKALLANELHLAEADVRLFLQSIEPVKGLIAETFSGKFYLDEENEWLDGAVQAIRSEPEKNRNVFMYCLFQASLQKRPFNLFHRANLNLRTNKVEQSFGNQTTWDTPFTELAVRAFLELERVVWRSPLNQVIFPPTDISEVAIGYDLVYLDPPYISLKNGGDDYLRRYHFLEGLCLYDEWKQLIDCSYQNLQFKKQRHISEWQNKRHFKGRLFGLIEKHRDSIVVLSYVDNAYPTKCELEAFFNDTFGSVRVVEHELSHALSKGAKNELLFIGGVS
jgi:adenine-specific DNA-methyltransferase